MLVPPCCAYREQGDSQMFICTAPLYGSTNAMARFRGAPFSRKTSMIQLGPAGM